MDAAPCGRPETAQRVGHRLDGDDRLGARAQNALNKSQPATTLPTLLLTTPGDSVLQTDELQEMVSGFSSDAKIKSVDFCSHDMLLSYDEEKNKEVVNEMIAFLKEKEKETWKQAKRV